MTELVADDRVLLQYLVPDVKDPPVTSSMAVAVEEREAVMVSPEM